MHANNPPQDRTRAAVDLCQPSIIPGIARCFRIVALGATVAAALTGSPAARRRARPRRFRSPAQSKKLKVVVKPAKPFVFQRRGQFTGYSIDLWKRVAQESNLDFEFQSVATMPELLTTLEKCEADVGVAALSITSQRESQMDFSHPFYESGLQILTTDKGSSPLLGILAGLLKVDTLIVLGTLLVALIVNAHLLWFFERKRNPEMFPQSYFKGVWEAAWWSICSFVTGGCENMAPTGVAGRLVAMVWMLAGVCSFSYITATIASTMTVNTLTGDIRNLNDLREKLVGTVAGSTSESFLRANEVSAESFPDLEAACRALGAGTLNAVVYDAPMLRYYLNTNSNSHLRLVEGLFDKQGYGFGLQDGSPYREKVNRALLILEEQGYVEELKRTWFGNNPEN